MSYEFKFQIPGLITVASHRYVESYFTWNRSPFGSSSSLTVCHVPYGYGGLTRAMPELPPDIENACREIMCCTTLERAIQYDMVESTKYYMHNINDVCHAISLSARHDKEAILYMLLNKLSRKKPVHHFVPQRPVAAFMTPPILSRKKRGLRPELRVPEQQASQDQADYDARIVKSLNEALSHFSGVPGDHRELFDTLTRLAADIHTQDDLPLRAAAAVGNVDDVEYLVRHGANVHADKDAALRLSCERGFTDIVYILLESGADVHSNWDEPLRMASRHGHEEIVGVLLEYGADRQIQGTAALQQAASAGHDIIVKMLVDAGVHVPEEALAMACEAGYVSIVRSLLYAGSNPSAYGCAALRVAAISGNNDLIQLLVQHGADYDSLTEDVVVVVASRGHLSILKDLVRRGRNARYQRDLALVEAVRAGHHGVVEYLLSIGCDPNAQDGAPVCDAAWNGDLRMMKLLLQHGANRHARQDLATRRALRRGHGHIVAELQSAYHHV